MSARQERLRICVVGDLEGPHTHRWVRCFVELGHDVHAVSFYEPLRPPPGIRVHVLAPSTFSRLEARRPRLELRTSRGQRWPASVSPSLWRLVNAGRYWRRGLGRTIGEIAPDVLHAHFVVEHGFYAALVGYHPYVVTAWGSDILVEAARSPLARAIARFALRRADLVTSNNAHMAERIRALGVPADRLSVITLAVDRSFLEQATTSANLSPEGLAPPTVVSLRSLDSPLYNVDAILRAMALVKRDRPEARLIVAGQGRLRPSLEGLAADLGLGGNVRFVGQLGREELVRTLTSAHVYVSVPRSDATAVSTLEAMGAGCFPILSDLPSQRELVDDGVNGLRVPVGDASALARAIVRALDDGDLRQRAAEENRRFVRERMVQEDHMAEMERWYYRLARATDPEPGTAD